MHAGDSAVPEQGVLSRSDIALTVAGSTGWGSASAGGPVAIRIGRRSRTAVGGSAPVAEIPDPNLKDVAVAVYDPVWPVIYFNPAYLERLDPALQVFLMTHERAHIGLKHTRGVTLTGNGSLELQRRELAADCSATQALRDESPEAVRAAVGFFARQGHARNDQAHPTGAQRAATILSCM